MRSRFTTVFALIAVMSLAVCPALAVPRTVLLEGFTQWNCGPCAGWNPIELRVAQAMGMDTVVRIKYHTPGPAPVNDPMYFWNPTENNARANYYGISGIPAGFLDGRTAIVRYVDPNVSENMLKSAIRSLKANPAPCSIELLNGMACSGTPTTVDFEGTITASDSALSNTQLFAALVVNSMHATGGANGETTFPAVFRDLWPNTSGQTISIAQGGTFSFMGTVFKDSSWNALDLSVVVFIQDYSTKWMHQAAIFPVRSMWGVETSCDDSRQDLVNQTDPTDYLILLENTGCSDDVFTVRLSGHLAAGWTRTVESPGITPDADSIQVSLPVGGQAWLQVYVSPNDHPGMAMTDVIAVSNGDRSIQATESFRVLANVSALVVDDDGSPEFDSADDYFLNTLDTAIPADMPWGMWDVVKGNVTSALLSSPNLIIWYSGVNAPGSSVTFSEQTMLANFLDRGGALLLTGESIAYDLRSSLFMPNYLHSHFSWIYSQAQNVDGVAGDPISDGLQFAIHGGDGSDNHIRPTAIASNDDQATIIWEYSGSEWHAGVKVQGANYRAVLMGFGVEAIDNEADRDSVMARSVRWLVAGLAAEPRPEIAPREFSLGAAYPNPFNPVTTIPYTLAERSEVSLRIFDVLGREVAVLAAGVQDAGEHRPHWRAADMPSGLYFCRLEAAAGAKAFHATQKIMLLK